MADQPLKPVAVPKGRPLAVAQLEELIESGCSNPECDHKSHESLVLNQACHPRQGVDAVYTKGTGVVTLRCHVCERVVLEISVALVGVRHG